MHTLSKQRLNNVCRCLYNLMRSEQPCMDVKKEHCIDVFPTLFERNVTILKRVFVIFNDQWHLLGIFKLTIIRNNS